MSRQSLVISGVAYRLRSKGGTAPQGKSCSVWRTEISSPGRGRPSASVKAIRASLLRFFSMLGITVPWMKGSGLEKKASTAGWKGWAAANPTANATVKRTARGVFRFMEDKLIHPRLRERAIELRNAFNLLVVPDSSAATAKKEVVPGRLSYFSG